MQTKIDNPNLIPISLYRGASLQQNGQHKSHCKTKNNPNQTENVPQIKGKIAVQNSKVN